MIFLAPRQSFNLQNGLLIPKFERRICLILGPSQLLTAQFLVEMVSDAWLVMRDTRRIAHDRVY